MNTLIALIIAIIAGFLADFILSRVGVPDPVKVLVAFLVGVVVFVLLYPVALIR